MVRQRQNLQLEKISLFERLSGEVIAALGAIATLYDLRPGDVLFNQGDSAHSFYVVKAGGVRLVEHTESGKDVNLKVYAPGDIFGLLAISSPSDYAASIVAIDESEVIGFRGEATRHLILRHPELSLCIIDELVNHVHDAHLRIRYLAAERTERRLARAILHFNEKFGTPANENSRIAVQLSQRDIAEFTGTTTETVNRLLKAWEEKGLVQLSRMQIDITDISALETLAEGFEQVGIGHIT